MNVAVSILGGDWGSSAVWARDLENRENQESTIEDLIQEVAMSIDSHTYRWEDLTEKQKQAAIEKGIKAYELQ